MNDPLDFNVEFCRALGLNPDKVSSATLHLEPLNPPRLTVEFLDFDRDELMHLVRLYHLELDEEVDA